MRPKLGLSAMPYERISLIPGTCSLQLRKSYEIVGHGSPEELGGDHAVSVLVEFLVGSGREFGRRVQAFLGSHGVSAPSRFARSAAAWAKEVARSAV